MHPLNVHFVPSILQVFNGILLPFFSMCLLLCLNDPHVMRSAPQTAQANICLFISVTLTLFLASNVLVQKLLGSVISTPAARYVVAGTAALVVMGTTCLTTSLGRDLFRSRSDSGTAEASPADPQGAVQEMPAVVCGGEHGGDHHQTQTDPANIACAKYGGADP